MFLNNVCLLVPLHLSSPLPHYSRVDLCGQSVHQKWWYVSSKIRLWKDCSFFLGLSFLLSPYPWPLVRVLHNQLTKEETPGLGFLCNDSAWHADNIQKWMVVAPRLHSGIAQKVGGKGKSSKWQNFEHCIWLFLLTGKRWRRYRYALTHRLWLDGQRLGWYTIRKLRKKGSEEEVWEETFSNWHTMWRYLHPMWRHTKRWL